MNISLRKIILFTLIATISLIVIFILVWVLDHGRLELSLPEGEKQVILEGNGRYEEEQTSSDSLSKFLPSGSYTLRITSESQSYVSVVTIPTFLRSKNAEVQLSSELGRQFVIDEPTDCFYPLKPSYVSYPCNGTLFGLAYHEPSTATKPSVLSSASVAFGDRSEGEADSPDPGVIEGVFAHKDKTYVVIKNFEEFGQYHVLYRLEVNRGVFDIVFDQRLDLLPTNTFFSASSDGASLKFIPESGSFLFTGNDFTELQRISTPLASDELNTLTASKNGTNLYTGVLSEGPEDRQIISGGIIGVSKENARKTITSPNTLSKTTFCFEDYICALEESGLLSVYTDELKLRHSIEEIFDFTATGNEVYLLDSFGVSQLTITDFGLEGSYVYTSPITGYSISEINGEVYISAQSAIGTHVLQLLNTTDTQADRVLSPLLESVFVEGASISNKFVHIAVDLGERVYIESSGLYKTDPKIKKTAEEEIRRIIEENEIEEQGLTVISPRLSL
jgi:hypothetical protein